MILDSRTLQSRPDRVREQATDGAKRAKDRKVHAGRRYAGPICWHLHVTPPTSRIAHRSGIWRGRYNRSQRRNVDWLMWIKATPGEAAEQAAAEHGIQLGSGQHILKPNAARAAATKHGCRRSFAWAAHPAALAVTMRGSQLLSKPSTSSHSPAS